MESRFSVYGAERLLEWSGNASLICKDIPSHDYKNGFQPWGWPRKRGSAFDSASKQPRPLREVPGSVFRVELEDLELLFRESTGYSGAGAEASFGHHRAAPLLVANSLAEAITEYENDGAVRILFARLEFDSDKVLAPSKRGSRSPA